MVSLRGRIEGMLMSQLQIYKITSSLKLYTYVLQKRQLKIILQPKVEKLEISLCSFHEFVKFVLLFIEK